PFVVPSAIKRVWDERPFDLLRAHSLRYIGPSALIARRRFNFNVPVVSHHHHLDPSPLNRLIEKRVVEASDRVVVGSEFGRRQLALEGRVVFTGYVPEAEKAAHFRLADMFLFPSAMEGFGFSVAEAMSAGVPVVASDRGSIPELVAEGQSGFVCDPSVPDRFV